MWINTPKSMGLYLFPGIVFANEGGIIKAWKNNHSRMTTPRNRINQPASLTYAVISGKESAALSLCGDGETRTLMKILHTLLKRARLPIPPRPQYSTLVHNT